MHPVIDQDYTTVKSTAELNSNCKYACEGCLLPGSGLRKRHVQRLHEELVYLKELQGECRSTVDAEIRVAHERNYLFKLRLSCESAVL